MAASFKRFRWKTFSGLLEFLTTTLLVHIFNSVLSTATNEVEGFILCRRCGQEIAKSTDLFAIPSKLAHRQRNETVLGRKGVLIQLFKNPEGQFFEVITSSEAEVHNGDKAYEEHSWFPGYKWMISVCPRCHFHIGWSFKPTDPKEEKLSSFVGMILDNILHEKEADNIIAVPKAYTS